MAKKTSAIIPDLDKLEKALGGDLDLVTFFVAWIKNGRNASKAYKELNPHVSDVSARTLGGRQLAKVDKREIMRAYGLDEDVYFTQLREGIKATTPDQGTGEVLPDHKTRKGYHDKLGKLIGIEGDTSVLQQFNVTGDMKLEFE